MDWVTSIMITGLVGFATFGLIFLLFAEIFRGGRRQDRLLRRDSQMPASLVTEEERLSLTRSTAAATLLSRASSIFRRQSPQAESAGKERDSLKPPTPAPRSGSDSRRVT